MSADVLRRAAALMRDRAEVATRGRWTAEAIGSEGYHVFGTDGSRAPMKRRARVAACTWEDWDEVQADAEHIASWHPAVALAVADLLDAQAAIIEEHGAFFDIEGMGDANALAVATAYLGER